MRVSIRNYPRIEQAVAGPEEVLLHLLSSLRDGDTTVQCSVKTVDTNEDEMEYDLLVT